MGSPEKTRSNYNSTVVILAVLYIVTIALLHPSGKTILILSVCYVAALLLVTWSMKRKA